MFAHFSHEGAAMKNLIPVIATLLFIMQASESQAATPPPATSTQVAITGWRLECDSSSSALACRVLDQITQASNGAMLVSINVNQTSDGKTNLTLQAPLGAAVSMPIVVAIPNGASQSVPFLTCSQGGCFATAPMNAALLSAMQAGQGNLQVNYTLLDNSLTGHEISVTIPLGGFAQAFAKLKK